MTLPAGLHYDVPAAVYHADPCPEPSLTQSIAKILLARSAAHARHAHPRLNPEWSPDDSTDYDIGNIAHRLILGRGRELEVLDFDDWRTKDARAAREAAADADKLGVLEKHFDIGHRMKAAAMRQLIERSYELDWMNAKDEAAEVVAVASVIIDNPYNTGFPRLQYYLRAMIDWLPSLTRVWDYKSTAMPCARSIATSLPDWCIQAAMHERSLNILDADNVGRREHRFVVQENYEPYALQVVRLTESHMTIGRTQIASAEAIWARCMATGEWPAYPLEDQTPEYPAWAMARVMEDSDVTD